MVKRELFDYMDSDFAANCLSISNRASKEIGIYLCEGLRKELKSLGLALSRFVDFRLLGYYKRRPVYQIFQIQKELIIRFIE
jgi:hypothetical protein